MNRIGIIGAGQIGSAFARVLARVGIGAPTSRTAADWLHWSAARADIVLVAVNWSKLPTMQRPSRKSAR